MRVAPAFALLSLILPVGLTACEGATDSNHSAAHAQAVACRQHADDVFLKQNRDYLTQRDNRDSPFSSTGLIGVTSAGLGRRYGRDAMIDDCMDAARNGRNDEGPVAIIDSNSSTAMDRAAPAFTSPGLAP
jgi:hypothetical protein